MRIDNGTGNITHVDYESYISMKEELEQIGILLREFSRKYNKNHVSIFVVNDHVHGDIYNDSEGKTELVICLLNEKNQLEDIELDPKINVL